MDGEKNALKKKKKMVVSGAGSFIARHFLRRLDLLKYEVVALVRTIPEKSLQLDKVKYIMVDMEKYNQLDNYIDVCDYYLSFAWNGTKREDRDNEEVNKKSYLCVLDSIKVLIERCGCSKVLIIGTFSEYKNTYTLMDETACCDAETAYGRYKYQLYEAADRFCRERGISFIEARLFSVYGPDDPSDRMIYDVFWKMINNEEILLTQAEHIWDFIHVDDVADALLKLMELEVKNGCYNVATMEHRPLKSYLEEMKVIIGSKSILIYGAIPYKGNQVPHVICDTRKVMRSIDWIPQISFEDGIKELMKNSK